MDVSDFPKKLSPDPIAEALFEIRFAMPSVSVENLMAGYLRVSPDWQLTRLQGAEVSMELRALQPQLRYVPVYELRSPPSDPNSCAIRISPQSVSFHSLRPYMGWEAAQPAIEKLISDLMKAVPDILIERLGLRYINVLVEDIHPIKGFDDLTLQIELNSKRLDRINLLFTEARSSDMNLTVRVAAPEYVSGEIPPNSVLAVDLDVFTPDGWSAIEFEYCMKWINAAHDEEKVAFFGLLKKPVIEAWRDA